MKGVLRDARGAAGTNCVRIALCQRHLAALQRMLSVLRLARRPSDEQDALSALACPAALTVRALTWGLHVK